MYLEALLVHTVYLESSLSLLLSFKSNLFILDTSP